MRIVVPSIAISCTSATPATGVLTDSSLPPCAEVICMKAPLAFCWGTVPRTQASFTVVWAPAAPAAAISTARPIDRKQGFMDDSLRRVVNSKRHRVAEHEAGLGHQLDAVDPLVHRHLHVAVQDALCTDCHVETGR